MIPTNYVEKVYASIIAMNAGIRLGAPVEPQEWTVEAIRDVFGDIQNYVKYYEVFSADDDANGPIFFTRALLDYAKDEPLQPEHVAKAWLNYLREGIGMIWWGGDQISTEHTVYLNLRRGIPAPQSGSIEQNGAVLAEQIGGQIFIDSFGLLHPNNPKKAADLAAVAASVSHDGDGINGARFMAACIAAAFTPQPIEQIVEIGLAQIPQNSTYAHVVRAVQQFHAKEPNDFYACRQYLEDYWGYDKYPGICHMIPNAGVCILALLYGQGDVSRTIEIATMCGWDTDCNAGNVGSIVGVLNGLQGIAKHYRQPINDYIVASSVSGYLNIVDLPTIAKQTALLGYRVNDEKPPTNLVDSYREQEIYCDFTLPGSTHGFKTSYPFKTFIGHASDRGFYNNGALEIFLDRMYEGDISTVYYQSFYRRRQFNDEKYAPTFAPSAYSGQTVSFKISSELTRGNNVWIQPYIRTTHSQEMIFTHEAFIVQPQWQKIQFTIPPVDGDLIEEVGIHITTDSLRIERAFGKIYLDEFRIFGIPRYEIDFAKQSVEFRSVTPFAHHAGHWTLLNDQLVMESETATATFTGHYYMNETKLSTTITPQAGTNHQLIVCGQGVERHYSLGFENEHEVAIVYKNHDVREVLASVPFEWRLNNHYTLTASALDGQLMLAIDGKVLLQTNHDAYTTGMVGFSALHGGKCVYEQFRVNM